ncbi:alpha/beta hydrolase [Labilibacter sediminis]|nr:alpha/beta hydrolase [Labilibacter sediminis]
MTAITSTNISAQQDLKLWPEGVPGAIEDPSYIESMTDDKGRAYRTVRVSDPTIKVYLPPKEKATGAAVLICPGGGYGLLAYDHEGFEMAQWLNTHGIAGIVLKYRLPSNNIMQDKSVGPLQDAQRAMRLIRHNAEAWNIQTNKIGIIGFSAGGHLASTLSTQYNREVYPTTDTISARPDYSILIYPVISMKDGITHKGSRTNLLGSSPSEEIIHQYSNELQINKQTPIAFLVHSANDRAVPFENSFEYFKALQQNKVKSELHIFEKGGHGYGMNKTKGTHLQWPEMLIKWMKMNKIIQ